MILYQPDPGVRCDRCGSELLVDVPRAIPLPVPASYLRVQSHALGWTSRGVGRGRRDYCPECREYAPCS